MTLTVQALTAQALQSDPAMLAKQQHGRHNAVMITSITIRKVPASVRDELAARAARSGRSLQEYLLEELIEAASRPDPAEVIARARERVRRTGSRLGREEIIGHLDADRR